jgi:hypothetical protein
LSLVGASANAGGESGADYLAQDTIPGVVMDALKARFPAAEIRKWTRESEGGEVLYDIEFVQDGRKCEADIKGNGTYINFEKEIAFADLPETVMRAVEAKYPMATLQEIMEITAVDGARETLEGYEVVLETADKKQVEVTVAPDGRIIEESREND